MVDRLVANRTGYLVSFALKVEKYKKMTKNIDVFGECEFRYVDLQT